MPHEDDKELEITVVEEEKEEPTVRRKALVTGLACQNKIGKRSLPG